MNAFLGEPPSHDADLVKFHVSTVDFVTTLKFFPQIPFPNTTLLYFSLHLESIEIGL